MLAPGRDHAGRFLAVTVRSRDGDRTDPLYVHAKVAIVDDERLIVGSANLNEHSLFNDTEMCVVTDDAALATATRRRLWAEHLECDETELAGEPADVIDARWRPISQNQLGAGARQPAGHPPADRLPGILKRTDRLRGPLGGLFVDG